MLKSITLKDYTTFITETTFDFCATNYKILEKTNVGENRILKGAFFAGENASGKTQTLNALKLLLDLLFENSEQNFLTRKSLYTKGANFTLKYVFDVEGNEVSYEIEFDGNTIEYEKLMVNAEEKLVRIKTSGNTNFSEKKVKDVNLEISLLKQEYYNTRFENNIILNKWFDFLKNSIYVDCLRGRCKLYNPDRAADVILTKYAEKNDPTKLNEFINKLGYGSEVVFEKQAANEDRSIIINSNKPMISLKKKGTKVALPLQIESTGNQAFINLVLPFQYSTKNDCMLIVDEFSSGLHNELEESLIRYFFNNSKNSQMFFVSHSTNLMNTYLLRPDQIYSFRFDSKMGTIIKRFSDENPRESQNMEKMYLSGVFDGLPKYCKNIKD